MPCGRLLWPFCWLSGAVAFLTVGVFGLHLLEPGVHSPLCDQFLVPALRCDRPCHASSA
jgi:hypothetical protein